MGPSSPPASCCAGITRVHGMSSDDTDSINLCHKVWKFLNWHGPTSTILLDNEARKFRDEPRNGIVVPEYGPAEVWLPGCFFCRPSLELNGCAAATSDDDAAFPPCPRQVRMRVVDTLASLEEYLLRLAEAAPADVRTYMEANPPALASWGRPVPENPIRLVAPAAPPPPLAAASTAPLQPKRLAAEGTSGSDTPAVAGAKEEEEGRTTVAADSLGELMSSLKIESKEPKAGPAASISEPSTAFAAAAKAPKEETQVDFSELALSAAAAAVGSSEEQQRLAEDAVPRGTALHLLCIKVRRRPVTCRVDTALRWQSTGTLTRHLLAQEGDFIVRNTKFGLTVRGPASSGIRVDAKMDFHRRARLL